MRYKHFSMSSDAWKEYNSCLDISSSDNDFLAALNEFNDGESPKKITQ